MKSRNVNLLVFKKGYMDEVKAGFRGAGETSAERGEASCTRAVEIGSGTAVGGGAANGGWLGIMACRRRPGSSQAQ